MREIKDALDLITGEKIYFTGHAEATYTRDGKTVEQALAEPKGLQYATERTVYLTRIENRIAGEKVGEYEVEDVTEEQRAYNRETITLNNEVLVLEGRFMELYESSDDYRRYSGLVATNGVCVYATITIFDTGEAVLVSDIVKFGLTFSEERTLYYPEEEGKELTEEEKAYNKETFELVDNGTPVIINIEGVILERFGSIFNVLVYRAKQDHAFISLNEDGGVEVIPNVILLSQDSYVLKSSIDKLLLLLLFGVVFPYIIDEENDFSEYRSDTVYFDDNDNLIIGFNKGQSRVNIIYDLVNDTLDIKEINMNGGSQSDFNLSFSKDF